MSTRPDDVADPRQDNDNWDALGADWRSQATADIDTEQLRRQVAQRGRRLRWALAAEVLVTAIAVGLCIWAGLRTQPPMFPPTVMAIVAVGLLAFQAWSLWSRRRQILDSGLDTRALLALERKRIATSLRYWRVNIWVTVALWTGLYGLWRFSLTASGGDAAVPAPQHLLASVLINAPVVVGFAVFAWRWCARARWRLRALETLQAACDSG